MSDPQPTGDAERGRATNTVQTRSQVLRQAIEDIRVVVKAARNPGHAPQKAVIGPVHLWMIGAARAHGIHIDGYRHVIDGSAVRHAINRHSNEAIEASRGQLPIIDADFDNIPDVIDSPDRIFLGTRTRGRRDQIGYVKQLPDGTTLYLEEVRTRKRELATVSIESTPPRRISMPLLAPCLPTPGATARIE